MLMATGVTPSICSFTKADMAMSGTPAAGRGVRNSSVRKLFLALSRLYKWTFHHQYLPALQFQ